MKKKEKSINELIDILKKEIKNYPKETSLNINERNRLIIHIKNLQTILITKSSDIWVSNIKRFDNFMKINKLDYIVSYLENPPHIINQHSLSQQIEINFIKREIDYLLI